METRTARARPRPRQDRRKAAGSFPDFPQCPAPARRCAWPYRIGRGRPCNKKQKYAVGILCLSRLSGGATPGGNPGLRSEEHTSELQSLMRISYAVFCLKQKNTRHTDIVILHLTNIPYTTTPPHSTKHNTH